MKATSVILISILAVRTLAQTNTGIFEAADFKVTEALIGNGVDVSVIHELASLEEQTLNVSPCTITVGYVTDIYSTDLKLKSSVQHVEGYIR